MRPDAGATSKPNIVAPSISAVRGGRQRKRRVAPTRANMQASTTKCARNLAVVQGHTRARRTHTRKRNEFPRNQHNTQHSRTTLNHHATRAHAHTHNAPMLPESISHTAAKHDRVSRRAQRQQRRAVCASNLATCCLMRVAKSSRCDIRICSRVRRESASESEEEKNNTHRL